MKELFSMLSSKEDEAQKLPYNLLRKLLRNQGIRPTRIITDKLESYGAALRLLGLKHLQDIRVRKNNRAECSHVPIRRRERKSQRFRSVRNAQNATLSPRSNLQSLQLPTPPPLQKYTPENQTTSSSRMEPCDDNGSRLKRRLEGNNGQSS